MSHRTSPLFTHLFISQYLHFKLGTALHDLRALCGNEFLTQPRRANIQVTATLTLADMGSCSTEERLLVSVRVYERQHTCHTMNQVVIAFQSAGNNKRQRGRASL
jgi:hypothetical protein